MLPRVATTGSRNSSECPLTTFRAAGNFHRPVAKIRFRCYVRLRQGSDQNPKSHGVAPDGGAVLGKKTIDTSREWTRGARPDGWEETRAAR